MWWSAIIGLFKGDKTAPAPAPQQDNTPIIAAFVVAGLVVVVAIIIIAK